jgi:colanic acid/amylovoran biosynthesis glycosyltransferase
MALEMCPEASLTLVGSSVDDGLKEKVLQYIESNHLQNHITLIDWMDYSRLHTFLKDYHVFIHPSLYTKEKDCEGGAPIVLLDAQATGMPIISTKHCDIPSEVINHQTGILCDENSIACLSEAIRLFYQLDQVEYTGYAKRCREHIERNFSIIEKGHFLTSLYMNQGK